MISFFLLTLSLVGGDSWLALSLISLSLVFSLGSSLFPSFFQALLDLIPSLLRGLSNYGNFLLKILENFLLWSWTPFPLLALFLVVLYYPLSLVDKLLGLWIKSITEPRREARENLMLRLEAFLWGSRKISYREKRLRSKLDGIAPYLDHVTNFKGYKFLAEEIFRVYFLPLIFFLYILKNRLFLPETLDLGVYWDKLLELGPDYGILVFLIPSLIPIFLRFSSWWAHKSLDISLRRFWIQVKLISFGPYAHFFLKLERRWQKNNKFVRKGGLVPFLILGKINGPRAQVWRAQVLFLAMDIYLNQGVLNLSLRILPLLLLLNYLLGMWRTTQFYWDIEIMRLLCMFFYGRPRESDVQLLAFALAQDGSPLAKIIFGKIYTFDDQEE